MPDGCLGLESAAGLERESWSGEGARAVLSDYARAPAAGGVVGMVALIVTQQWCLLKATELSG